jgi:hypothetical protein
MHAHAGGFHTYTELASLLGFNVVRAKPTRTPTYVSGRTSERLDVRVVCTYSLIGSGGPVTYDPSLCSLNDRPLSGWHADRNEAPLINYRPAGILLVALN